MAEETTEIGNGWVRDAEGRLRRATVHHMGRRRNGWDYCAPCIYEITIVLEDRRSKALGRLVVRNPAACAAGGGRTGNPAACAAGEKTGGGARDGGGVGEWLSIDEAKGLKLEPDQVEARVERSALGAAIFAHFRRIAEFTPEIRPLYCEVMPDHLHMILQVLRPMKRPLGNAIAGFKTGCEKIYAKMGGKGRLFVNFEPMAFQPFRIEHADNAALLENVFGWLSHTPVTAEMREEFRRNLFLTEADLRQIAADEK